MAYLVTSRWKLQSNFGVVLMNVLVLMMEMASFVVVLHSFEIYHVKILMKMLRSNEDLVLPVQTEALSRSLRIHHVLCVMTLNQGYASVHAVGSLCYD